MPSAKKSTTSIRKDSLSHKILMIAKFYRRAITIDDMTIINPLFSKPGRNGVNRALLHLETSGFLYKTNQSSWILTPEGERLVMYFGSLSTVGATN